nr:CHASE domain-containing protein [Rhodoferax sp.]
MRKKFNFNPLQYGWNPLLSTLVLLVAGLSLTAYSVYTTRQHIHDQAREQLNENFDRIDASIRNQFTQPLYGMRGAIGAQASTGVMRRANFGAYVAARDIASEFPGVRGFGYIERVMRTDLARFEATEKADQAPDFSVKTQGDAADLYVIKYIEPLANNRAAQGLDLGSEPIRRAAVERAIDTGEPSLSNAITLVQDGKKGAGFLYLVPVFKDGTKPATAQARRAQLAGLFFTPLVANELLSSSTFVANGMVDFELFDDLQASAKTLVFFSQKMIDASAGTVSPTDFSTQRKLHKYRALPIEGRLLLLRAGSSARLESQLESSRPLLVGVGGVVASLLMAISAWLLLVGRARAQTLARAMTKDLDRLLSGQKTANQLLTQSVRESQALMAAIDQHSIVSIADPAGNIIYVNELFSRISGYSRKELMGQNHRIVKSDAQSDEFWAAMWKTISSGYVWHDVVCNRAKDGARYWVDAVIAPFFDKNGAIEKYVSIRTDITAKKDYESSLHTAVQEAQAATVAKSQFLANMSHEIRTPMNAILGMLKLLHSTDLSKRQLDYASKTEDAAKSLLVLLNNILDFSKIDADRMALDSHPFRLDRLLRNLSVIVSANVAEKPVEVLFDIDPAVPKALIGDSMRLQQVLINLSGNAIKFTAQGEVVIQVKVLARTGPDTTLRFSVRDSGIGIAPENQKHIFDDFSQAETSTTRRFGGTGLGLSICKRLVALMGGELALDSVMGQGSTFYFTVTLPATDQVPDDPDLDLSSARLSTHLSVLVVDDNAVARELLVTMAQSWGWQVDVAASGVEAVGLVEARAKAAQAPYQAVFMDWEMPGMDGWETSLRLRQITPSVDAPIIVMVTAHGRERLSQRSAQEQARLNGFLVKPVTASMLFDAVVDAQAGRPHLRASPRVQAAKQRHLEGLRLLVVEDNLINQQIAQELLSAEGALIELAANGQLGVAAVAAARPPFDAVLMDIQMPVMDGYTATRLIRHELGLTDLPVIAMTANAMASDREACLAAGMNDHVGKPFDLSHLIKVLQSHIRRSTDAASAPAADPSAAATPASAAAHGPAQTLPPVDTVDVEGALKRLGDNTALYARILQSYLDQIASLPDQLDGLLQRGELAGAAGLLHTLKGLSATVGASYLAAVARQTESIVKSADASLRHDVLRADFRAAVASTGRIMGQIAERFTPPAAQGPAAATNLALDTPRMLADIRELHDLLNNSDMRAVDVYAQLRHTLAHSAPDELKGLDAALATFDFAQGMIQCKALLQKFSPSI